MKSDIISAAHLSAFSRTCFLSTIIFSRDRLIQLFHPFYDNVLHTHTLIKASINHLRLFLRSAFKITVKSISRGEGGGFSDLNSDLSEGDKRFFDPPGADKLLPVSADRGRPCCASPPPTCKNGEPELWRPPWLSLWSHKGRKAGTKSPWKGVAFAEEIAVRVGKVDPRTGRKFKLFSSSETKR